MSDKAYYISQMILVMTVVLVVVSAAGFDLLSMFTFQAWIGTIMMLIAMITLVSAVRMFRRA